MPNKDDIIRLKQQFKETIEVATAGTPFTLNALNALACQETGEIRRILRKRQINTQTILELCVGDTIDASSNSGGWRAFPNTKAGLLSTSKGDKMFSIARQVLLDMPPDILSYQGAVQTPNKFVTALA